MSRPTNSVVYVVLVDELVVGEREHQRGDERDEVEEAEPDQPGGDEQQTGAPPAPLAEGSAGVAGPTRPGRSPVGSVGDDGVDLDRDQRHRVLPASGPGLSPTSSPAPSRQARSRLVRCPPARFPEPSVPGRRRTRGRARPAAPRRPRRRRGPARSSRRSSHASITALGFVEVRHVALVARHVRAAPARRAATCQLTPCGNSSSRSAKNGSRRSSRAGMPPYVSSSTGAPSSSR